MRVLLVKTSSLGDVVHNLPAAADLARAWPAAQIDWLVEEDLVDLPRLSEYVHTVIPLSWRRWRKALWRDSVRQEIAEFLQHLRQTEYDLVIDSQGLIKSALWCVFARVGSSGKRCGFDANSAREGLASWFYQQRLRVSWQQHALARNRQLVAASAGYAADFPLCYGVRALAKLPTAPVTPYAMLLTATARAEKRWADEHWRALAVRLAEHGLTCLLPAGSVVEQTAVGALIERLPKAKQTPPMSLLDLARLMQGAALVVGVDTGLTHLASALGRPTLGLYVATDAAKNGVLAPTPYINLGAPAQPPQVEEAWRACKTLLEC